MQKGLSSSRTGYNTSASLYGGDQVADVDSELDSYWKNAGKKGSKKKKGQMQQQNQNQQNHQQQQQHKKSKKSSLPAGFVNLGYGSIDQSSSLVFTVAKVTGTCRELEKDYLRLTSQADPARVRDPATLARALTMVKRKWIDTQNYEYTCNQLKSIRQDCTVQHLRDQLTVEVYETHARIALEAFDLQEFAQCQTQLQLLYREGITGGLERECEFAAYKILYSCLMTGPSDSGLVSFMNALPPSHSTHPAVSHALAVRSALLTTNYALFFHLWTDAPNMSAYIMDPLADGMRVRSARIIVAAYRPRLSLAHLTRALAFDRDDSDDTAAAAAEPSERPPPTQAQMRACKAYLDEKFEGLFVYVREAAPDGLGAPRVYVDCKATADRLAPTNAAHRLPINSARAAHTASGASAAASAAAGASPSLAPIAAPHDVASWIKKDHTGRVRLGALDDDGTGGKAKFNPLPSGNTGQPRRLPLFTPSPSPSPPPAAAASSASSASLDAVSRKRKNTQPLSSMSYEDLRDQIADLESQLLDPHVKEKFDDFNLSLMMSRLKALQKAFKKMKKPK